MKRFILVVTDYGEHCNGHARLLGCFDSEEAARTYAHEDMKDIVHAGKSFAVIDEWRLELWEHPERTGTGSVYTVLDLEKEED